MSVLLQGLSIPDGNPRTINIYRDGVWCDAYTTENGKVIEVPPHGRLIDADAFLQTIRPITDEDNKAACTIETVKKLFNEHISSAPTIIPAEEGET